MRPDVQVRRLAASVLFAGLASIPAANAQLPNLSQVTNNPPTQTTRGGNTQTTGDDTPESTGTNTGNTGTNRPTQTTAGPTTAAPTTGATTSATGPVTNLFPSNPLSTASSSGGFNRLSGAPTLQGVGIPTMVVPYTANAPFMQKSTLPEGTVFIAVGATLAFLGFCVIAWRALVAWSINRSVKRAALASIMASETKNPGGWASNPFKPAGGFYSQAPGGSTLSLGDGLRNEKTTRGTGNLRNPIPSTGSGLFFSPTASNVTSTTATANIPMTGLGPAGGTPGNRSSSFLPAGYYASPSSTLGGGASTTTIGGPGAPYATPTGGQGSPSLAARRSSAQRPLSNMQLAPPASRDGNRLSGGGRPVSGAMLHPQGSASSLQVGTGHGEEGLPGSRAPSAYLEDLFESHGNPAMGAQGHGQGGHR